MTNTNGQEKKDAENVHREYEDNVLSQEQRKLRALKQGDRSVFFGLGMFGLVGWSVAIPTLLCTGLGVYLDMKVTSSYSWALMLLFVGIVLGCWNGWFWIAKERRAIEDSQGGEEYGNRK